MCLHDVMLKHSYVLAYIGVYDDGLDLAGWQEIASDPRVWIVMHCSGAYPCGCIDLGWWARNEKTCNERRAEPLMFGKRAEAKKALSWWVAASSACFAVSRDHVKREKINSL
jgi:hypothetical protein